MKNFAVSVVLCLVLWSCNKEREDLPNDVLPHDRMVGILIDLHIAESKLNEIKGDIKDRVVIFNAYADQIYEEHETDSLQYKVSHDYYMQRLDVMKGIYQKVSDSLKVLRDSASTAKKNLKTIKPKSKDVKAKT